MNRRQMVILPGIALAASQGFSQTPSTTTSPSTGSTTLSHKAISRYSRLKSFAMIPKSTSKQAKYVNFLTTLLSLTSTQQTQTATIFSNASASHATVKTSMKTDRQSFAEAVENNDGAGIEKVAGAIGRLTAQRHSIGGSANAAFLQILSADQQAKFIKFKS
jgi:hypothetical protein